MGEHNPQVALVTTLNEVFEPGGMMQVFTELNEQASKKRDDFMFHPPVSRTVVLSFQSASTFAPYTEAEVTAVLTNMLHSALTRYDEAATIHITEVKLPSRRKSGYVTFVKVHH